MATPIRMAPVLYGKDAEFFYEQWAKMRETPDPTYPTKEEQKQLLKFMKKYKVL